MTWIAVGVTGGSALLGYLGAKKAPKQQTTTQGGTSFGQQTTATQIDPRLMQGANQALINSGQIAQAGGSPVAPVSSVFGNAVQGLQGYGQQNNPYLQQMFNTAADATQNRQATEFSMSGAGGVNSPSHQQARSQELQTLAASIFGQGFENERNRGLAAAPLQLGAGQYLQQDMQNRMDAPANAVNQQIAQLQGLSPFFPGATTQTQNTNQTGNVTQPLYNNPLAGAAGGAMLGQALLPGIQGVLNRPPQQPTGWVPRQYGSWG